MGKVKAVIFDLDGTLADTILDLAAACNYVLKNAGQALHTVDEYKKMVGGGRAKLLRDSAPEYAQEHLDEMIDEFNQWYNVHFCDETCVYDGMVEAVKNVRAMGIGMAVLSNKPHEMTVPIVEKLYPGMFDLIYGQMNGMPVKPSLEAVDLIADKLGVKRDELVIIGDSEVDVKTAKNANARSIAVSWGYRDRDVLEKCEPDVLADEAWQVVQAIDGMINN